MKSIPESSKFIVADHNGVHPINLPPVNPRGWYHSVTNVVNTPEGLVASYRLSDNHCAVYTHIMTARSTDGGRTWTDHTCIARANVWEHHRVWVAPQMSRLKDGRLVILADLGHRTSHENWPMLTHWQKPSRGMWNYLFWSEDNGRTWSEPVKCDDVGGEPGFMIETADGTLLYTATVSDETDTIEDPPMPWGSIYYKNILMASTDGGVTWSKRSDVTDAPFHGDCEVGLVELAPDHLLAVTRVGFGGGSLGNPSRFVHSHDNGRTWGKPSPAPFYGQRTMVGRLQDGRLFTTFRNRWGTFASYAFAWREDEQLGFEPTSFIWEEERCRLEGDVLKAETEAGVPHEVLFSFYPAMDSRARVEVELEVRVPRVGDRGWAFVSAGFPVHLLPDGIAIERPDAWERSVDATGSMLLKPRGEMGARDAGVADTVCSLDLTVFRRLRFVRTGTRLSIHEGDRLIHESDIAGRLERPVRFGAQGPAEVEWKSASVRVTNPHDESIDWSWSAASGTYPDQFRRDRMIRLDFSSDTGYSGWAQLEDGTVVITDYTNDSFKAYGSLDGPPTRIKAYRISPEEIPG